MVQGKVKTKVQVPGKSGRNKQKYAHQKKKGQPKLRGARYIAPKKAKQIEAAKLKKNISKAISSRNEQQILSQAASKEPKKLSLGMSSSSSGDAKKKGTK